MNKHDNKILSTKLMAVSMLDSVENQLSNYCSFCKENNRDTEVENLEEKEAVVYDKLWQHEAT